MPNFLLPVIFVVVAMIIAVGFALNRYIASTVLSSKELDPSLYARWNSPDYGGGLFLIQQKDQGKLLFATFHIVFNAPSKLTQSQELQSRLSKIRRFVLIWNLIGLPVLAVWLWFFFTRL